MKVNDQVRKKLEGVIDPELGADIVSLGLIYDIRVEGSAALVRMTMTTPFCPLEDYFRLNVAKAVREVAGIKTVNIDFVFEPAWTPEKILPAIRAQLGFPANPEK